MSARIRFWLFAFSLIALPSLALPQDYTVAPLVIPNCFETYATGINDKQQIVFSCWSRDGVGYHGLWRTDWFDPLVIPGSQHADLSKTNEKRRTVGSYWDLLLEPVGFKAQPITEAKDAIFPIVIPGAYSTWPKGINDSDEVAGEGAFEIDENGPYVWRGFFRTLDWATKTYTFHDVFPPNAVDAHAYDVNNRQVVFGSYVERLPDGSEVGRGFLYDHKARTYQPVEVPGALGTVVTGGNDKGQYTGYYWDGDNWLGFVWTGTQYVTFTAGLHTHPQDINNLGHVVGIVYNDAGPPVAESFRANPSAQVAAR